MYSFLYQPTIKFDKTDLLVYIIVDYQRKRVVYILQENEISIANSCVLNKREREQAIFFITITRTASSLFISTFLLLVIF